MTLKELLRTHTHEAQDALDRCEDKIRDLGSQRRAEISQANSLQTDIDGKRKEEEDKRLSFDESAIKLRDLERQIEDLRRECERLSEHKRTLTSTLVLAEEEVQAALERKKKATTRGERLEHQIRDLVVEKERFEKRLRTGRRAAFKTYQQELEARLSSHIAAQEELSAKFLSRRKLEQARHEDSDTMDLYEERSELQKLLKISTVATVHDHLAERLKDVEDRIEALFPGALSVEGGPPPVSQIEEIFFRTEGDSTTHLFLPISQQTWNNLASHEIGAAGSTALRFLWGIAKGLELSAIKTQFKIADFIILEIDRDVSEISDTSNIEMPLPGSGTVSFLLSKLPHELEEAIRDED